MNLSAKKMLSRRNFLRGGSAAVLTGLVDGAAGADVLNTTPSKGIPDLDSRAVAPPSVLIRNANIVTMDPKLGDLFGADIFVKNGKIEAVGANLTASADEIIDANGGTVIPGFVDGHRHLWQTSMRGQGVEWTFADYMKEMLYRRAVSYTPADMLIANYVGGLEAINAGVTSVVDHSHNTMSPEHAEAAIEGMIRSGVGGFYCYGLGPQTPYWGPGDTVNAGDIAKWRSTADDPWRHEHVEFVKRKYFSNDASNLKFGIATSFHEWLAPKRPDVAKAEFLLARKVGAELITQHAHGYSEFRVVPFLEEAGLLDDDILLSHAYRLTDKEFELLAKYEVGIAVTPESEIRGGNFPAYGLARAKGVNAALGVDTVVEVDGNMFSPMRFAIEMQRFHESRQLKGENRGAPPATGARDALEAATIGGARALGVESRIGSIVAGKQADMVLFNSEAINLSCVTDPVAAVVHYANISDIDSVWIQGQPVKRHGKLVGIDWPQINQELKDSQGSILERASQVIIKGRVGRI